MKLSEKALKAVSDPQLRALLALELKCTDQTILRNIRDNGDNNDLTKMAAILVIKKKTGMLDDEIFEIPVSQEFDRIVA